MLILSEVHNRISPTMSVIVLVGGIGIIVTAGVIGAIVDIYKRRKGKAH